MDTVLYVNPTSPPQTKHQSIDFFVDKVMGNHAYSFGEKLEPRIEEAREISKKFTQKSDQRKIGKLGFFWSWFDLTFDHKLSDKKTVVEIQDAITNMMMRVIYLIEGIASFSHHVDLKPYVEDNLIFSFTTSEGYKFSRGTDELNRTWYRFEDPNGDIFLTQYWKFAARKFELGWRKETSPGSNEAGWQEGTMVHSIKLGNIGNQSLLQFELGRRDTSDKRFTKLFSITSLPPIKPYIDIDSIGADDEDKYKKAFELNPKDFCYIPSTY